MSPDLIAFLKAWHDWATSGAPDRKPFARDTGLCSNSFKWAGANLEGELQAMFDGEAYPFGEANYNKRWGRNEQHECPKRLAWVRARLVEAGEMVS